MNVALHSRIASEHFNVISLCTGGGGLDLGLELAIPTARAAVYLEREAFAVAHLVEAMRQGLLAEAPIWSDVRTFAGRPWRGLVDGLIGGIPCQPHSLAGNRLGEDDERDLWSDARRIIVQCRPWFVIIENVEGMLTSGGAERVWRDLCRLGYTVEIGLFSASETGASHQRNRVFVVAVADDAARRWHTGTVEGKYNGDEIKARGRRRDVGHPHDAGLEGWLCGDDGRRAGKRATGPAGGTMVDAARDGRGEGRSEPSVRRWRSAAAIAGAAVDDAEGCDWSLYQGQRQSGEPTAEAGRPSDLGLYPPAPADIDGWRRVLAHSPHLEPAVRKLANELDGGIYGTLLDRSRIDQLRLLGNGVVPIQAAHAIRTLLFRFSTGESHTRAAAFLSNMIERYLMMEMV